MKFNQWTLGLAAAGVVSLASVAQGEEAASHVMTALSSTTLSGYVDTSAIWNFGSEESGDSVPGRSYDGAGKQDGFNLNVFKLRLEKPLAEGDWSAGYLVDLVFGPDGGVYDATGQHIKQAYVALRVPVGNGIDLKMGVFDTCLGYEVFDAGSNPNYSRSYAYGLEPTQHEGVLASYRVSDWLSLSAGVANTGYGGAGGFGAGGIIGARSGRDTVKTYMGSVTLTAPDSMGFLKGSTLYLGAVDSGVAAAPGDKDIQNYYVGVTVPPPLEHLTVGAAFDLRKDFLVKGLDETAVGIYASYQATEKLRFNGRAEWVEASGGPAGTAITGTGFDEILGLTLTVDYKLWDNVLSRLELRYDNGDFVPGAKAAFRGFSNGEKDDNLSLALNVIYKF